jgi:hypothetical protein
MVIFLILYVNYRHENVSWLVYLLIILLGFPYVWAFNRTFRFWIKQFQENLLQEEPELGQPVLKKACINHFREIIADGGVGYVLQDRLIFVPHKMNLSRKEVNIPFSEVESITDYKIWGIFDTGLKITMKSSKVEKFEVDKTTPFYTMLLNMIRK